MIDDETSSFADLELEQTLLKYLITQDVGLIPYISDDVFHGSDEKIIFSVVKDVRATFSLKMFKDILIKNLADGFEDIEHTFETICKQEDLSSYKAADIILNDLQDLYLQRMIIQNAESAINYARLEQIDEAMTTLQSIFRAKTSRSITAGEYTEDIDERISIIEQQAAKANEEDSKSDIIPTGIALFDKEAGGLKKGELGVVVAQPGGGKSITLLNIALSGYFENFNVVHVGLEMSKTENQFRADSYITNIPANMYRLAKLDQTDFKRWKKLVDNLKKSHSNYLEFVGAKSVTISDIIAIVEGIEAKHNKPVDLVILDYLTLIKSEASVREFHMQQWDTVEKLTTWLNKRNIGGWTGSQSTDEGISRKDGMKVTDVKYSKAIAEYAQLIVALHQTQMDEVSGELNWKVIKGRSVKAGYSVKLKPDFANMVLDTKSYFVQNVKIAKNSKLKGSL